MPIEPSNERKPYKCSQCGKDCGRARICRLRLYHKYISFLIDKELEKLCQRSKK